MEYRSDQSLSEGTFFHVRFTLVLVFNPRVPARSFRLFEDFKCKYKVKLLTKNRRNLGHIRVRRSK